MSTKKILLIVGGIFAVLVLLVGLFVGGIVWVAFSTIGKSEAAQTAKAFLRQNEKLKSDIGEVRDFGFWIKGNINSNNGDGEATLYLKVIGAKKTVPAHVNLAYQNGRNWIVVGAYYINDAGHTVELLEYSPQSQFVAPEGVGGATGITSGVDGEYIKETFAPLFDSKVLDATEPVVVIFDATSSEETRQLLPALNELAKKYSPRVNFYIVNVDVKVLAHGWDNKALAEQHGVHVIPTLILFRHGKESKRIEGARPIAEYSRMLEKQIKR